ncbi:hypothetical protein Y032_0228g2854 [Ancylostoma ceylanicum]|uniref:SCAP N-terminal domain-containing protein n=1 Tax=Ancylostoma ceylanicum TaxID=53326 RepID=A0A016SH71_9BILA|nr:hypothetical protein Y032_0228g2854 [Ancylostoma ceylanicum]
MSSALELSICSKLKRTVTNARVTWRGSADGRLCAAHPVACLSMSLMTMVVLSYPTFTKFHLPANNPISIHWDDKPIMESGGKSEWSHGLSNTFLQQVEIRGAVEPWISLNLTSEQAVRGPISRAFLARKLILEHEDVDASCLQVISEDSHLGSMSQQRGCLLFDPTAFWEHSYDNFMDDSDVLSTIFSHDCSSTACFRDLFLGIPIALTGIKNTYRSNRKRSPAFFL